MSAEMIEWLGLVTVTFVIVGLAFKTTNVAYWIGLSDEKEEK